MKTEYLTNDEKLDLNLAITAFRFQQITRAQQVFSLSIEHIDWLDQSQPSGPYLERLINENYEADVECEAMLRAGLEYGEEEEDEEEYYPVSSAELDTWAEIDSKEIDGLNGEEEALAKRQLIRELEGREEPTIL